MAAKRFRVACAKSTEIHLKSDTTPRMISDRQGDFPIARCGEHIPFSGESNLPQICDLWGKVVKLWGTETKGMTGSMEPGHLDAGTWGRPK